MCLGSAMNVMQKLERGLCFRFGALSNWAAICCYDARLIIDVTAIIVMTIIIMEHAFLGPFDFVFLICAAPSQRRNFRI